MSNLHNKSYNEAVVLLNMGGPNNLFEVEVFLKNMFNDPLILRIKNKLIQKIVSSMIINTRIDKVKSNYKYIGSKSPLVESTFKLTQVLQELDKDRFYTYAMRYTPPFSSSVVEELKSKNISKITLFSMYPQYSSTTTLSSVRDFLTSIKDISYDVEINIVESYPVDKGYIETCIEKIKESKEYFENNETFDDFVLLLSTHSVPQSIINDGDVYEKEVIKSVDCLKESLKNNNINFKDIQLCYQSKLGPIKWLEPSTIDMIKKYKNENIIVYPLSFSIDNYETDFELDIENRKFANEIGVSKYIVCKCPNYSISFAKAIINLINSKGKSINEANI
ncbi:ferrochelatase [Helicobacter sp. MIT 14-3879]|uniref:ferrochelatase n=1 Tax=Helicobacter sp. MIT 14-3879 TaxID=2040649 RepID=UPI00216188AB|nr:ferrochelatase [Helicobacter sp. MIT 14-3879]